MGDTDIPTLDELKLLFVGDWIHDDQRWDTTPCYSAGLAAEIARRCSTGQEFQLRRILYGDLPIDNVPAEALTAIQLGVQRYRNRKQLQNASRGL